MAEDERTDMAKSDKSNARRVSIDTAHSKPTKPNPSLLQQSKNLGRMLSAATRQLVHKITKSNQHRVTFAGQAMVAEYNTENTTVMVTWGGRSLHNAKDGMSLRSLFHNSPQKQQRPTHSMISQLHS
jgi:hypothetical protein